MLSVKQFSDSNCLYDLPTCIYRFLTTIGYLAPLCVVLMQGALCCKGAEHSTGSRFPQNDVVLVGARVVETAGLVRPGQGRLIQNARSEQPIGIRHQVAELVRGVEKLVVCLDARRFVCVDGGVTSSRYE